MMSQFSFRRSNSMFLNRGISSLTQNTRSWRSSAFSKALFNRAVSSLLYPSSISPFRAFSTNVEEVEARSFFAAFLPERLFERQSVNVDSYRGAMNLISYALLTTDQKLQNSSREIYSALWSKYQRTLVSLDTPGFQEELVVFHVVSGNYRLALETFRSFQWSNGVNSPAGVVAMIMTIGEVGNIDDLQVLLSALPEIMLSSFTLQLKRMQARVLIRAGELDKCVPLFEELSAANDTLSLSYLSDLLFFANSVFNSTFMAQVCRSIASFHFYDIARPQEKKEPSLDDIFVHFLIEQYKVVESSDVFSQPDIDPELLSLILPLKASLKEHKSTFYPKEVPMRQLGLPGISRASRPYLTQNMRIAFDRSLRSGDPLAAMTIYLATHSMFSAAGVLDKCPISNAATMTAEMNSVSLSFGTVKSVSSQSILSYDEIFNALSLTPHLLSPALAEILIADLIPTPEWASLRTFSLFPDSILQQNFNGPLNQSLYGGSPTYSPAEALEPLYKEVNEAYQQYATGTNTARPLEGRAEASQTALRAAAASVAHLLPPSFAYHQLARAQALTGDVSGAIRTLALSQSDGVKRGYLHRNVQEHLSWSFKEPRREGLGTIYNPTRLSQHPTTLVTRSRAGPFRASDCTPSLAETSVSPSILSDIFRFAGGFDYNNMYSNINLSTSDANELVQDVDENLHIPLCPTGPPLLPVPIPELKGVISRPYSPFFYLLYEAGESYDDIRVAFLKDRKLQFVTTDGPRRRNIVSSHLEDGSWRDSHENLPSSTPDSLEEMSSSHNSKDKFGRVATLTDMNTGRPAALDPDAVNVQQLAQRLQRVRCRPLPRSALVDLDSALDSPISLDFRLLLALPRVSSVDGAAPPSSKVPRQQNILGKAVSDVARLIPLDITHRRRAFSSILTKASAAVVAPSGVPTEPAGATARIRFTASAVCANALPAVDTSFYNDLLPASHVFHTSVTDATALESNVEDAEVEIDEQEEQETEFDSFESRMAAKSSLHSNKSASDRLRNASVLGLPSPQVSMLPEILRNVSLPQISVAPNDDVPDPPPHTPQTAVRLLERLRSRPPTLPILPGGLIASLTARYLHSSLFALVSLPRSRWAAVSANGSAPFTYKMPKDLLSYMSLDSGSKGKRVKGELPPGFGILKGLPFEGSQSSTHPPNVTNSCITSASLHIPQNFDYYYFVASSSNSGNPGRSLSTIPMAHCPPWERLRLAAAEPVYCSNDADTARITHEVNALTQNIPSDIPSKPTAVPSNVLSPALGDSLEYEETSKKSSSIRSFFSHESAAAAVKAVNSDASNLTPSSASNANSNPSTSSSSTSGASANQLTVAKAPLLFAKAENHIPFSFASFARQGNLSTPHACSALIMIQSSLPFAGLSSPLTPDRVIPTNEPRIVAIESLMEYFWNSGKAVADDFAAVLRDNRDLLRRDTVFADAVLFSVFRFFIYELQSSQPLTYGHFKSFEYTGSLDGLPMNVLDAAKRIKFLKRRHFTFKTSTILSKLIVDFYLSNDIALSGYFKDLVYGTVNAAVLSHISALSSSSHVVDSLLDVLPSVKSVEIPLPIYHMYEPRAMDMSQTHYDVIGSFNN